MPLRVKSNPIFQRGMPKVISATHSKRRVPAATNTTVEAITPDEKVRAQRTS